MKCCAPTTTRRGIPESPKHKEQSPKQHKYQTQRKAHENNDLTRYGLNVYVLGAIKERLYYFGRSITMDAAPLSIKRAATFLGTTKP